MTVFSSTGLQLLATEPAARVCVRVRLDYHHVSLGAGYHVRYNAADHTDLWQATGVEVRSVDIVHGYLQSG